MTCLTMKQRLSIFLFAHWASLCESNGAAGNNHGFSPSVLRSVDFVRRPKYDEMCFVNGFTRWDKQMDSISPLSNKIAQQRSIQEPSKLGGLQMASSSSEREDEIRKKIMELKREGRLKTDQDTSTSSSSASETSSSKSSIVTPMDKLRNARQQLVKNRSSVADEYADKLSSKLGGGGRKGRMMASRSQVLSGVDFSTSSAKDKSKEGRKAKLGALDPMEEDDEDEDDDYDDDYEGGTSVQSEQEREITSAAASDAIEMLRRNVGKVVEEEEDDMDEEDMVDIVAQALSERGFRSGGTATQVASASSTTSSTTSEATSTASTSTAPKTEEKDDTAPLTPQSNTQKTSGVGGSWSPPKETTSDSDYQPSKSGTWGAFPRPRNISTAYGGGKRVGAGVRSSAADAEMRKQSIENTKARLRAYREKMGIEVQSEKDNAEVIEEALTLAGRAMQRGSYSTGVSALEKVTQYCSTKSKLGGKVFLELAMAYEAEGKTDQAIALYAALSKSPIERIKMNADRLLYGLEAMNFMRNEAKLKEFSRKKAAETFVDATGFRDITKNFDKVYNTAYIDLDKGGAYYRMLTENVVRSTREARQILLKAVGSGEVDRMKIVQALRSISRHFDEELEEEKKEEAAKNVPVDYAGRPIVSPTSRMGSSRRRMSEQEEIAKAMGMDGFILSSPTQTLGNLEGEWRLQLMADKKGDGVDFFNSTLWWQTLNTTDMKFNSESQGYRSSSGNLSFEEKERILSRENVYTASAGAGGFLSFITGGGRAGQAGQMTNAPQQILSVDSALLVTRAIVTAPSAVDNVKDYFSVWRRVEPGTYSRK